MAAMRLRSAVARFGRSEAGAACLAVGLALLLTALTFRLWRADISRPIDTRGGDAYVMEMVVKATLDHGWYQTNPDLGAPLGQQLYDFPAFSATNLHWGAIRVIGLFSSRPGLVYNLYYLLGFALTALAAFLVLRRLRFSRPVAIACASVFTLLPDHFLRGEAQLSLSQLFVVPAAAYLVLALLAGEPLFRRSRRGGSRAWISPRSLTTLALAVMIGASDPYYASFTAMLLVAAGLLRLTVGGRRLHTATTAGVLIATVGGTLALDVLPNVLYRHQHGRNALVANRRPFESEFLGTNLARLVTPIDTHRLAPFARAGREYDTSPASWELFAGHIGLISSAGLLALLAVALATCSGARRGAFADERLRHASAAGLTMLLIATTGGISALIAYWVSPQLRDWGRASSFIAFFALVAVAVSLDAVGTRLAPRRHGRAGFVVLLGAVVCLAVFDQTSNSFVPDYRGQAKSSTSIERLIGMIETRLPRRAAVFQLPYEGFPEAPTAGIMKAYDAAIPYLHSHRLRWSYGAMQGRRADWAAALQTLPPAQVLPAVAAVGFQGVLVDRFGYPANHAAVEAQIAAVTHAAPLESRDHRFVFFDLRPYRDVEARVLRPQGWAALRRATLHPPPPAKPAPAALPARAVPGA
jgi:hypothetical protein